MSECDETAADQERRENPDLCPVLEIRIRAQDSDQRKEASRECDQTDTNKRQEENNKHLRRSSGPANNGEILRNENGGSGRRKNEGAQNGEWRGSLRLRARRKDQGGNDNKT